MLERILNKWQFEFKIEKENDSFIHGRFPNYGWYELRFNFLKFISLPNEACRIEKEHYKGARFKLLFWLPFY